jgi:predicted deacylase
MGGKNVEESGESVDEQVISANVELGTMQKTLAAFGTVASANEEDISVPGDIRVLNYNVSVGDAVSKGDIIATVDRNTVLAKICGHRTPILAAAGLQSAAMEIHQHGELLTVGQEQIQHLRRISFFRIVNIQKFSHTFASRALSRR